MDNNTRWQDFNSIIDNEYLDHKEKSILLIIFRFSDNKSNFQWSYPSRNTLKKLYGTKRDETLDNILNSLYKKNILIKRTGKGNRNEYQINYDILQGKVSPENEDTPKNGDTSESGGAVSPKNGGAVSPKNGVQKENKRIIKEYIDLTFIDDVIDKVKIAQEQYNKLVDKFGNELVNNQILALDNYIANGKGAKYKDHYRVLNTWCSSKVPKAIPEQITIDDNGIRDF